ncbi:hypothetical protein KP509_20G064400 [Ceratopteris richardii]|uniref:Crossover junction endonuclease MUS81 n=1 Tax=Ceratopteris richardii TaxID=49495 RepID=A0A8T2SFU7_CERRI|nr:hypothetical protein KP509_20G064400 [Ceratopteris richardii]
MEGAHVRCVENEPLAMFILEKRQALIDKEGYKERLDATLSKAFRNICECERPICSLSDANQIRGIGQWTLKLLKGFFPDSNHTSREASGKEASRNKPKRRYVPQKSSAPYAILLTLYKAMQEGRDHMKKQELIDAADASGLSRMSIQPSKSAGPSGQFAHSTKDWYSGWSSMKTLVSRGLVFKSSCPAKYKLTEEGILTAEECLERSGIGTKATSFSTSKSVKEYSARLAAVDEYSESLNVEELTDSCAKDDHLNCPSGYKLTEERISSSEVCAQQIEVQTRKRQYEGNKNHSIPFTTSLLTKRSKVLDVEGHTHLSADTDEVDDSTATVMVGVSELAENLNSKGSKVVLPERLCSYSCEPQISEDHTEASNIESNDSVLAPGWFHLPPLLSWEKFSDVYEVILVLDDRERFTNTGKGNSREKFAEHIKTQFRIEIEIRHLPVGDTLWIARHKVTRQEYVLDFIVERKNVSDLLSSIKDARYKQQKLRLMRCGLRKLIYVVEGDPNVMDSAESIKTACLTTEIVEGFDVQRTTGVRDTMRKYGDLTHAIAAHYDELSSCKYAKHGSCKTYRQFVDDCKDLERDKVSDIFGIMLMQIKHVTENVALAILDKYPTPLSLKGDEKAQELLLKGLPIINQNKEISAIVSKNVFQFMCASNVK